MTEHQVPGRASAKDLKSFSDQVSPHIVDLLDTSHLRLPKQVHQRAKRAAKDFSITREVKLSELLSVTAFLAAYGQFDRLNDLARAVTPVPYTGNETLYEPIREIIHLSYYFAKRRNDAETASKLAPYLIVPDDFTRPPGYLAGELLRGWLEMPPEKAEKFSGHPVSYHAGKIVLDLLDLASISVCGGSSTWTPERIDAQVDKNIAGLFAVPGYAPPAP